MTRDDLATKLSLRMNVSKKEADKYVLSFLEAIMTNLLKDGRVVIQGFGSFKLREYQARESKKPMTDEPLQIPARNKPLFHASKELKEIINNGHGMGKHRSAVRRAKSYNTGKIVLQTSL